MKIKLALEWFINPDHLPFIVGLDKGLYKKNNIELEIIEPEGHYDGFKELAKKEDLEQEKLLKTLTKEIL